MQLCLLSVCIKQQQNSLSLNILNPEVQSAKQLLNNQHTISKWSVDLRIPKLKIQNLADVNYAMGS